MEASKCWKMNEFSKILNILRAPNNKTPHSVPHQIKATYASGTKTFYVGYTGIWRHLISQCFENAVLGCLKMVQWKCFSGTIHKMFVGKFVSEWVFGCIAERELSFCNVEWVKVRKISDFFCVKLYCKVNDFFASSLALRLSARKYEIKR